VCLALPDGWSEGFIVREGTERRPLGHGVGNAPLHCLVVPVATGDGAAGPPLRPGHGCFSFWARTTRTRPSFFMTRGYRSQRGTASRPLNQTRGTDGPGWQPGRCDCSESRDARTLGTASKARRTRRRLNPANAGPDSGSARRTPGTSDSTPACATPRTPSSADASREVSSWHHGHAPAELYRGREIGQEEGEHAQAS